MTDFAARMDALTVDDLRRAGSLKWTAYPDAIGAWVAEMDFGLAPAIAEVLGDLVARQQTGYAPLRLRSDLKAACADFLANRYGWQVPARRVHWLPDVLTGLAAVMTHGLPPHSGVIMPTPCYMPFVDMPRAFGHRLVQLPMLRDTDQWQFDLDGLDREFTAGARLLVLCNPHNPIGKVYSRTELEQVCEVVEHHGGLVFSDEIHAPLTYPGAQHVPYASINDVAAAHTVTALSASKAFNLAGLKCAQLVLTRDDHQQFWTRQGHGLPYEATPMGVAANIAAFRDSHQWLEELIGYLDGNRRLVTELVAELLPEVRMVQPDATYLALLDCRQLGLANPRKHFLAAGVALTDGADCGDAGRGHVRLNFAMPRPILRRAIEQMAASIR
ncbi:MAG: aminotransferase class I/II-fold pyridoxal phosphate-dependent enzyme [Brooklawnia sp.]|uniref:MalY/PatB family protein n=1 Tax=Brooklawnia sp. TaxID=2699740 RepID=UPI003C73AC3F